MTGRAFVRAWPADAGEPDGRVALVGIVRCPLDVDDEVILGHALIDDGERLTLAPTGWRGVPEWCIGDHDVGSILTGCDWPRPAAGTGLDGGGILLRRTEAPSPEGTVTCILVCLLACDALPDRTFVDVEADASGVVSLGAPQPAGDLVTDGMTLSQILRLPLWGWEDEPWGLVWTLRLDVVAQCRRLDDLAMGSAERFAGERAGLERGPAGSVMGTGARDPEYQRFRRLFREEHGSAAGEAVLTRTAQEEHARRVESVLRRLRAA